MTKPTIAERARQMICPECGGEVVRKSKHGRTPIFCQASCRMAHNNRAIVNGAAVIAYLKAWRIDRGSGEVATASLSRICEITDSFNEEDRKAGRPRADLYAAKLIGQNYQRVDELRYGKRKVAEARRRKEEETAKENQDG